ncbi:MAG TPA: membrane protein insertase YidC [Pseudothermotoga sp.]|nr:membrane protein insertase YidC [Pseudothermotoga sp.]HOK83607.1 membrane protein insertase YidC [Pseudothermotoga sp.]HPP69246.1 membrane protein insertase YidC [Pseudothermotoga sp.]
MRKSIVLILITILMVVAFPKNEIQVTNLENGLKVTTRFNEFELNTKGDLVNVYLTIDRKLHIFQADGDGLELFSIDGSPLNLLSSTVKGTMIAPNTYSGDLSVIYEYENGVRKILTFKNAPEYVITVEIESADSVVVTLPRVWYEENDRAVKDYFLSFAPKNRIISISKTNGSKLVSNKLTVSGFGKVLVHMAPYKRIFLKKLFADDYPVLLDTIKKISGSSAWYDPFFYPLVWFFWWLFELTKNFGWTIVVFTVIVRLVLYPLYHAQTKSMIKMRKLQPKVEAVRKKYKDPTKQQEELMKVYKEEGVNPASGCLMLLIQLPIFFLLYAVIRYFQEEFAFGSRFLFWNDLSIGGFGPNALFIIITIVASYYNTLITSQDTRSAWQGILMSVIFPFLFVGLPSGLFLYYTLNTVIQLVITYYIYKRYKIKGITTRELLGLRPKA